MYDVSCLYFKPVFVSLNQLCLTHFSFVALRDIPENGFGGDQHQREKTAFLNSAGLKSIFEKLRFRDVFVLTAGLTVEIKLCFQIPPV